MLFFHSAIILQLLIWLPFPAVAADDLMKALLNARETSAAIKHQESVVRDAEIDIAIAEAALNPDVYLEVGAGVFFREKQYDVHRIGANTDGSFGNVSLSLTHTLLDNRERINEIEARISRKTAEEKKLEHYEQQTFLNAAKAYFNFQHDRSALDFIKQQLDVLQQVMHLEAERFKLGNATMTDHAIGQVYLGLFETAYHDAKMQLQVSASRFKNQTGYHSKLALLETSFKAQLPASQEEAALLAKKNNPALAAHLRLVDEAHHLLATEKASVLPKLYLDGYVSRGNFPQHDYENFSSLGLRVKIPLFQNGLAQNRIAKKKEASLRAQIRQQQESEKILASVGHVFRALKAVRMKLRTAKKVEHAAKQAYLSAVEERDYRLRSTPEMLEVHEAWQSAVLRKLDLQRQLNISRFSLLFLMGTLRPKEVSPALVTIPVPAPRRGENEAQYSLAFHSGIGSSDLWNGLRQSVGKHKQKKTPYVFDINRAR